MSNDEQIACEIRHQKLLHQAVFPAYTQLAADLNTMLPLAPSEPLGLAHVPNGTSYFQWLLTYQIGTDRTISEIRDLLEEQIATDYETILEAVQNGMIFFIQFLNTLSSTQILTRKRFCIGWRLNVLWIFRMSLLFSGR